MIKKKSEDNLTKATRKFLGLDYQDYLARYKKAKKSNNERFKRRLAENGRDTKINDGLC